MSDLDLTLFGDDHVRHYLETNGESGYEWNGATVLVLFTTGRKSGLERRTPLIFTQVGDHYVIIASQGGAPTHPNWFHNLQSQPDVEVQVKGDRFRARARVAEGEERTRLWAVMVAQWPSYDVYQERTDRQIPLVVLERTG
jgi:deazaflavin-dependent oxidoreductase (nitroreductase family)